MSEPQDPLDRLLDEALISYGEAPENEGLEQRILVRVAASARVTHRVKPWMLAMSAALTSGIAFLSWWMTPRAEFGPPGTTTLAVKTIQPTPQRAIPPSALKSVVKIRKSHKAPATPKLPQFPTPSPPSSEEQALVHLVTANRENVLKELTSLGGPLKPIQISAIEIKPLRSGVEHEGETCCDQ